MFDHSNSNSLAVQALISNVAEMNLNYITEGSLPIKIQNIDPATGKMSLSLEVLGSEWQPLFEEETWQNKTFLQVCFHDSFVAK